MGVSRRTTRMDGVWTWRQTSDTARRYNHKFWQDFRDAVKEANPNAIVLAEHYGDASSMAVREMSGIPS